MEQLININKLPTVEVKTSDDGKSAYTLATEYVSSYMGCLYFYNNNFYKRDFSSFKYVKFQNESELKTDILKFLYESSYPEFMLNKKISNMITALKGICLIETQDKMPYFITKEVEDSFIPLKNGILNVESYLKDHDINLFRHDPDYFSTSCLDFDYDPEAESPTFQSILDFALPNKEVQRVVQQWIGHNLVYSTELEKIVMFLGKGRNGKSLLLFILRTLLGDDNISTVPLENFGKRFQTYQTVGKLANIVGEVSDSSKFPETAIKSFVSGEPFTADIKFKDPIIVYPTARITVAANNFPYFRDTTDGLWRRIILIAFERQVDIKDVRPEYMTKEFWYESGEIKGIFNWALQGLKDLKQNGLQVPQCCKDQLEEIKSSINPVESFLSDHLVSDTNGEAVSKEIFERYQSYCFAHGYKVASSAIVGREIKKVFPRAKQEKVKYIPSLQVRSRVWSNIRLKTSPELEGYKLHSNTEE